MSSAVQRVAYDAFFCWALSAFLRLLLIMITDRKEPTTVVNSTIRITGMRMAQTRGRKSECSRWSSSTKGWGEEEGQHGARAVGERERGGQTMKSVQME